ncbi:MAG: TRAP transporter small permease subunit [Inquilinaceae bacterium]
MTDSHDTKPDDPGAVDPSEAAHVFDHLEQVTFRTRLDIAVDAVGRVVSLLFLVGVVVSFVEVVLRYVFARPTLWAHETTIAIVAILFAYGGAYTLARDKHIRIVLIYDALGPRAKRVMDVLNAFLTLLFAVGVGYAAIDFFDKSIFAPDGSFRLETSGSAWNPPIPPVVKGLLMVSLMLIAVQSLLHLIQALLGRPPAATGDSDPEFNAG